MNLNWVAICVAFIVAIVTGVFGRLYLPINVSLIGPIVGGLIAGYMVGGSYTDGIVNGGIPAGIAGLISFLVLTYLLWDKINLVINNLGYYLHPKSLIIVIIGVAFGGFVIYFVLGIIGAIFGIIIKRKRST